MEMSILENSTDLFPMEFIENREWESKAHAWRVH